MLLISRVSRTSKLSAYEMMQETDEKLHASKHTDEAATHLYGQAVVCLICIFWRQPAAAHLRYNHCFCCMQD